MHHAPDRVADLIDTAEPLILGLAQDLVEAALDETSRLSLVEYDHARYVVAKMVDMRCLALDRDRDNRRRNGIS